LNNKDNNYITTFQEKLNDAKSSTKFYHQTIYDAANPPQSNSTESDKEEE